MQFSGPSLTAEAAPADGMELGPRAAPAAPDDAPKDFDQVFSSAPGSRGARDPDASAPADANQPAATGSAAAPGRPPAGPADASADSSATAPATDQADSASRAPDSTMRDPGRRRRGAGSLPVPAADSPTVASAATAPLDPAVPPPDSLLVGAWAPAGGELLSSSLAPAVRNAATPDEGGAPAAPTAPPGIPGLAVAAPSTPAAAAELSLASALPLAAPTTPAGSIPARKDARPAATGRTPADEQVTDPAALSASPATARVAPTAPGISPGPRHPDGTAEKFAAPAPLATAAMKSAAGDSEKKMLTIDGEKIAEHTSAVGTVSAEPAAAMTTTSFLHAATFLQGVADRVSSVQASQTTAPVSAPATTAPAAPLTAAGAPEAVAAVMKLIQAQANQSQGGVSAVNLSFKFGDDSLSVHVAWRDGIVQTQFRTDSDELRAALAGEWQSMSAAPAGRALPLAAPVFSSSSDSASASGDESRQSAQSGFGRDWGQSDGGPASAPLVPSGPFAPRRPPTLVAAGRLHAFA